MPASEALLKLCGGVLTRCECMDRSRTSGAESTWRRHIFEVPLTLAAEASTRWSQARCQRPVSIAAPRPPKHRSIPFHHETYVFRVCCLLNLR